MPDGTNPFGDLIPQAPRVSVAPPSPNPFADLVPQAASPPAANANPFADLVPPPQEVVPPRLPQPPAPGYTPPRTGTFAPSGGVPTNTAPLPVVRPGAEAITRFLTDAGTGYQQAETPIPVETYEGVDWSSRPQARPSAITNAPVGATATAPTPDVIPLWPALRDRNWTLAQPPEARPSAITNAPIGSTVTAPTSPQTWTPGAGTELVGAGASTAQVPYAIGTNALVRQRQVMDAIDANQPVDPNDDPMGYASLTPEQRSAARQQLDQTLSQNLGTLAGWQQFQHDLPKDPDVTAYHEGKIGFMDAPFSVTRSGVIGSVPALGAFLGGNLLAGPIGGVAAATAATGPAAYADQVFNAMRQDGVDPNDPAARLAWVNVNGSRLIDAYGTQMGNALAQNIVFMGPFEAARYLPVPFGLRTGAGVGLGAYTGGNLSPTVQEAITSEPVPPQERTLGAITGGLFGAAGAGVGRTPFRLPSRELSFRPQAEVSPREAPPPPAPPVEPAAANPFADLVPARPSEPAPAGAEPGAQPGSTSTLTITLPPSEPVAPAPAPVEPTGAAPGVAGRTETIPPAPAEPVVRPAVAPAPAEPARTVAPVEPPAVPGTETARPPETRPGETQTPVPPPETRPVETPAPVPRVAAEVPVAHETARPAEERAPAPPVERPAEERTPPAAAPTRTLTEHEVTRLREEKEEALQELQQTADQTSVKDLAQHGVTDLPDQAAAAMITPDGRIFTFRKSHDYDISHADFAFRHSGHDFVEVSSFNGQIGLRKNSEPTPAQLRTINAIRAQVRREGGDVHARWYDASGNHVSLGLRDKPAAAREETPRAAPREEPAPRVARDLHEPDFAEEAFTERQSRARRAYTEAGHDPAKAENYPVARKAQILAEHVSKKFGFKNVTVNSRDLQRGVDQLLDLNDNAHVFAAAHGIPLEHIGQGATLALRPRDRRTPLGSWHPGTRTLSLFGRSNSFAHEWWHMMDQKLVQHLGRGEPIQDLASRHTLARGFGQSADLTTGTTRAFANLLNEIYTGQPHLTDQVFNLLQASSHRGTGPVPPEVLKARGDLYSLMSANRSDYLAHSEAFARAHGGDPYWIYPHELVARAGEAFSAKAMKDLGLDLSHSEVISKSDRAYLSNADERFALTFPKAEERNRIHAAMSDLLDNMRRDQILGDGRPGSARQVTLPGSFDQLDPARWVTRHVPPEQRGVAAAIKKVGQGVADDARMVARLITDTSGVLHQAQQRMGIEPDRGSLAAQAARGTKRATEALALSMGGRMGVITKRYTGEAQRIFQTLRDKFDPQVGTGRFIEGTYGQTVNYQFRARMNKLSEIFKRNGLAELLSPNTVRDTAAMQLQKDQLRDALTGHPQAGTPKNIIDAAAAIRSELTDLWYYAQRAGIDMGPGFADEPYFPRVLVHRLVEENKPKFLTQAGKTYGDQFDQRLAGIDNKAERLGAIRNIMHEIRDADGNPVPWHDEASARAAYAASKAQHWYTRLMAGHVDSFQTLGPDAGFRNTRVLPASADIHMRDFYVRDPIDALQQHVRQAVSHAEYVRRTGTQENMQRTWDRLADLGVKSDDIAQFKQLIELTTGRNRTMVTTPLSRAMDWAYAAGTMALMPRAVFASLAEPAMVAVRSGDVRTTIKAFQSYLTHWTKGAEALRAEEIAQAIGVVTHSSFETIMADRLTSGMHEGAQIQHMLTNYYARTGLTALTNYQRTAMVAPAEHFIRTLLTESQGKGVKADRAKRNLRELGMDDPTHERLNQWLNEPGQANGLRADKMLNPEGELVGQGIARFIDQVIQDPTRIDKPEIAFNPYGRFVVGLMSFNMALTRNLHGRMWSEFKSSPTYGEAAGRMAPYLLSIPVLIAGNMLVSLVRDQLFGVVNPNDNPDDKVARAIERGISRSGLTGTLDPLVQAATGLRYQRSINALFGGAQLGFFTQAAENILKPVIGANSPNTNTAERAQVKGFHAIASTALMAGIAAMPGGWLSAAAGMWGTSAQGANLTADLIAGPAQPAHQGHGPPRPPRPPRPSRPGP